MMDLAKAIEDSQRPPPEGENPSEMWSKDLLGFIIVEDDGHGAPRHEVGGMYYPHELDAAQRECERQRGRLRHPVQIGVVVPLRATEAKGPEIVCLCGSSRFVGEMAVVGWELEKEGKIVLGLHLLPAWYKGVAPDHQAEAEGVAEQMDELHLRKIDLADRVLVVDVGGYIGDSTRAEIEYATRSGKPTEYLSSGGLKNETD